VRPRRSRGVSTAEVLVGVALSLFTLATLSSFFRSQQRSLARQHTYAQSQNVTRTVIDLFARELRMASYDPTGLAIPVNVGLACPGFRQAFTEATPTRVRFKQDLDGNGTTTGSAEDLVYELVSNEVRRRDVNVDGATGITLVSDVPSNGLKFRYFDGSNPAVELLPTGTPPALTQDQRNCISKIGFTIQANLPSPDPDNHTLVKSVAKSQIAIRQRSLLNF
jgi:Tfp pilus assembly protein PilW